MVGNERPWKVLIGSPKISDIRLNFACLAFKRMTVNKLFGVLLLAIFIVFKTNQDQFCNVTFEGRAFRQACAVWNEYSGYEILEKNSHHRKTKEPRKPKNQESQRIKESENFIFDINREIIFNSFFGFLLK